MNKADIVEYFHISTHIENGAFGRVSVGISKSESKEQVAIKHMYIPQKYLKHHYVELNIYPTFDHPNILKVHGVYTKENDYWLVMPKLKINLKKYIEEYKDQIDKDLIKKWIQQLLSAVQYCHQQGTAHCDIKPDNLLIDDQQNLQLIDFGSAKQCTDQITFNNIDDHLTTISYSAPEILVECPSYNQKVDIWAIGCIFFELFAGTPLFYKPSCIFKLIDSIFHILGSPKETGEPYWPEYYKTKTSKYLDKIYQPRPEIIDKYIPDPTAKALLLKMLVMNPEGRINCKEVLEHKYFKEN